MDAAGVTIGKLRGNTVPVRQSAALLVLVATIACAMPAAAALDLTASAGLGFEHNSNPNELSDNEALLLSPDGKSNVDDTSRILSVSVGANLGGTGPLRLRLQGAYSHMESQRFDKLGHTDYNLGGNLDWAPVRWFDMSTAVGQSRSPIRQADAGGEVATQNTSQNATMTLRVRPTTRWQLALTPGWAHSDLPLANAPDYEYRTTSLGAALSYLGSGRLVPGLQMDESSSRNSAIGDATRYRQRTVSGVLNYQTAGLSNFSLALGRTERTTHLIEPSNDPAALANEGRTSGFTGSLSFHRQLSVKTGINLAAFRNFQQYDAGDNLMVDTGFNASITWAATPRISVSLGSQNDWTNTKGLNQGVLLPGSDDGRKDLVRSYQLNLSYSGFQHVSISSHATRSVRRSEVWSAQFNTTIVGVDLTATLD